MLKTSNYNNLLHLHKLEIENHPTPTTLDAMPIGINMQITLVSITSNRVMKFKCQNENPYRKRQMTTTWKKKKNLSIDHSLEI